MLNRRCLLQAAGPVIAVPFAGCLGNDVPSPQTDSPTTSPPIESRVDVPDCPEKPNPLNQDNVVSFAVQFEKAYFTRVILRDNEYVTYVQFKEIAGVSEDQLHADVTPTEEGFLVRFDVTAAFGYRPEPKTPETAHADLAPYTANYFVSDQQVVRAKSEENATVDPRQSGDTVHCPPE